MSIWCGRGWDSGPGFTARPLVPLRHDADAFRNARPCPPSVWSYTAGRCKVVKPGPNYLTSAEQCMRKTSIAAIAVLLSLAGMTNQTAAQGVLTPPPYERGRAG